jgi:hypothetical protein
MITTTNTISGENCIFMGSSLQTKKYKCIISSMWIITAWQCISSEVTMKGFKNYCISNAVEETEYVVEWQ